MPRIFEPDTVHRLVKLAVDAGEVTSFDEAERLFASYRLGIDVGADVANSPTLQVAVLTAVNTARRSFLGGVQVSGDPEMPLQVPWRRCRTLGQAVADLQGSVVQRLDADLPRIVIGDGQQGSCNGEFALRATFDGWVGGVTPLDDGRRLPEQQECIPAGVLAGGLAVSEAFQFVRGDNAAAGHRDVGLSLWDPEPTVSWLTTGDRGPALEWLPSKLWIIGLGHLGQAYLWTLAFLPYAEPGEVALVLQDYDTLVTANDSTSLLTTSHLIGRKKTRTMAQWCEERGFRTMIQERRFASNFQVAPDEPRVALCGVDNALARAALEEVGFDRSIEAGLGAGPREYLAFQVHTFPASRSAKARWGSGDTAPATAALLDRPAYRALADAGLDECGLTTLAGRTVGASFVGATTAAIVIAESLRMAIGEQRYEVIDGSLRSLGHRQAVRSEADGPFNPGVTRAR
jgi:hypothetical protein